MNKKERTAFITEVIACLQGPLNDNQVGKLTRELATGLYTVISLGITDTIEKHIPLEDTTAALVAKEGDNV